MVTLNIDRKELEFVANVIGELPTKSNSYPLLMQIIQCINENTELSVDDNQLQFIVNLLNELPTKTGAFNLLNKITEQLKPVETVRTVEGIVE
jgi:hypothetical protein